MEAEDVEAFQARSQLTECSPRVAIGWKVRSVPTTNQMDSEDTKPCALLRKIRNLFGKHRIGVSLIIDLQTQTQIHHEVQLVAKMRYGPLSYRDQMIPLLYDLIVMYPDPREPSSGQ